MLSGNRLQDELMAKEEARIKARREANEQRRVHYLNAKVRLIGLNVQALDQQVLEKQQQRSQERDVDKFERTQALEIERILAQSMEEEKQMKEYQMNSMKKDWENAMQARRAKAAEPTGPDFDPARCGPSAALKFSGEDGNRYDRLRLQKEQMRKWIQEQVAEKAHLAHLRREEDMSYGDMIKAIDEIRENTEREERELRNYIQSSVKDYNLELAKAQKERNRGLNRADEPGNPAATSLDLFAEDKNAAMDEHGRIIRRDMFKGFTEEQKRKILADNQNILRQKSDMREAEKQQEYDWAIHQIMTLRAMEAAEFEEKMLRDESDQERWRHLKEQMEQQKKDRMDWNKTKYGDINGGFFDGFGKTCR